MDLNMQMPQDDEVHVLDYLLVLAKYSRIILYTSIVIAVTTFFILLIKPNQYQSSVRLIPPQQNTTLSSQILDLLGASFTPGGGSSGMSMQGGIIGLLALKSPGDFYTGILSGDTMSDQIIKRFNLRNYYRSWYDFSDLKIEDIRKELDYRVDIRPDKDGLITIEVIDENPKLAADIANAYVEELDLFLQKMSVKEAEDRLAFLERERSKTSTLLAQAEENLRSYSEKANLVHINSQTKGIIEYIAQLRAAVDAKDVQIKVMQQQATPLNYDIVMLETELQGLKEKLKATETQDPQNVRAGDVMIATSKIPTNLLEYGRLYRDVKYQEALYDLYCKLVELSSIDILRDYAIIQVVDHAFPAEKKSRPRRLFYTLLSGIISMLLMTCGVVFWELKNQIITDEDNTAKLSQIKEDFSFYKKDYERFKNFIKKKKQSL
jgi:tyrosine-protein kinase Etk/Wzc